MGVRESTLCFLTLLDIIFDIITTNHCKVIRSFHPRSEQTFTRSRDAKNDCGWGYICIYKVYIHCSLSISKTKKISSFQTE